MAASLFLKTSSDGDPQLLEFSVNLEWTTSHEPLAVFPLGTENSSAYEEKVLLNPIGCTFEAEPPRKKKKIDPRKDFAQRERLKKKIRKLERAAQELVPIEDFIVPFRFMDEKRIRELTPLSLEESEKRAKFLKKWSVYKQRQDMAEMDTIKTLVAAQEQALRELRLESEELYQAAILRDDCLFPFDRQEPLHTPPQATYEAPEGKCNDLTRTYTY